MSPNRLNILSIVSAAIALLLCAGPAFAQQDEADEAGATDVEEVADEGSAVEDAESAETDGVDGEMTERTAGVTTDQPRVPAGSTMEAVMFYVVGGAAALCAIGCVLCVNIVRMAVCLFGTLGSVAILYFLMAANFLGAIQLIVYAGGTLVVIIFGVMLTTQSPWLRFVPRTLEIVAGAVVCLGLFVGLVTAYVNTAWPAPQPRPEAYSVDEMGRSLLTTYLVPFELASVLLLAVMIGAAYLARPEHRNRSSRS